MSLHELSKRTAPQDLIQFAQKYIQAILRDVSEVNCKRPLSPIAIF